MIMWGEIAYAADRVALRTQIEALRDQGEHIKARPLAEQLLELSKRVNGPQSAETADALRILGVLKLELGEMPPITLLLEALAIDEQVVPRDDKVIATDLRNLGLAQRNMGDLLSASKYFKRALVLDEQLGLKDEIALDLSLLGGVYRRTGQVQDAVDILQRVIAIREKAEPPQEISLARDVSELAQALAMGLSFRESEAQFKRAIELDERNTGQNSPTTAANLNSLARLYIRWLRAEDNPERFETTQAGPAMAQ